MSSETDLKTMQARIEARPVPELLKLDMPVDTTVAEGEKLVSVATEDKTKLVAANLDWTKVELLAVLVGALRQTQSNWNLIRFTSADAAAEWNRKILPAFEQKETVIHGMTYGFRLQPELLQKIDKMNEGSGDADFIQDCNDAVTLAQENEILLEAIKFPMVDVEVLVEIVDEMSKLLAKKDGAGPTSPKKILRDKALAWTKELVEEIYACGQYVFWKDKERKTKYRSAYIADQNRRAYLKSKESAEPKA